jgi:hypothetical protein
MSGGVEWNWWAVVPPTAIPKSDGDPQSTAWSELYEGEKSYETATLASTCGYSIAPVPGQP